jgi:hypothetical protein
VKEALIYLSDVKARLATSPAVADITVVAEHVSEDRGYFRARLLLANGDLLDISEYFTIQAGMRLPLKNIVISGWIRCGN